LGASNAAIPRYSAYCSVLYRAVPCCSLFLSFSLSLDGPPFLFLFSLPTSTSHATLALHCIALLLRVLPTSNSHSRPRTPTPPNTHAAWTPFPLPRLLSSPQRLGTRTLCRSTLLHHPPPAAPSSVTLR
jgi:hypothetical protein